MLKALRKKWVYSSRLKFAMSVIERRSAGRAFQYLAPATEKARFPNWSVVRGTFSWVVNAERNDARDGMSDIGFSNSDR